MGMIGNLCVLLDASRGAYYRDDGEDVHHRGAGDRLRHRGECGVRANPGAAGVRGINFGGGHLAASDQKLRKVSKKGCFMDQVCCRFTNCRTDEIESGQLRHGCCCQSRCLLY